MARPAPRIPRESSAAFEAVVEITDAICSQHLNVEYGRLCRGAAEALARKRPSPLLRGRADTWACGIVYAIGSVNFLFDPSQTPHMRAADLCQIFGVSQSAGSGKARIIAGALRMGPLDPRWTLPGRLADNPVAWMIEVNGFIVDARSLSLEHQREAHRLGLIPYVPNDRA